ncbi:hypothetical protein E2C01_089871 [Portunus trituberculatus]|uniref:Uncharacterized protein n=1 Tax=Portunus trituberculatus TaxID=210409 RepID=A0A5B7J9Z7_PORTR|nr:hypothetical protein [Portunus trituberculatus]
MEEHEGFTRHIQPQSPQSVAWEYETRNNPSSQTALSFPGQDGTTEARSQCLVYHLTPSRLISCWGQ